MEISDKTKSKLANKAFKSGLSKRGVKRELERKITQVQLDDSEFIRSLRESVLTVDDFNNSLRLFYKDREKEKGDVLELFSKCMLLERKVSNISYFNKIKDVVLHNKTLDKAETEAQKDLRSSILHNFNLPDDDEGIDGYFVTADNKYGAFQAKVRTSRSKNLTIGNDNLGTFLSLASNKPCKVSDPYRERSAESNFEHIVVISTAASIPDDHNNPNITWILRDDIAEFLNIYKDSYGDSFFIKFSYYLEGIMETNILSYTGKDFTLRPHQLDQKKKCQAHFIKKGNSIGIMLSPTGTGKTRMIFENIVNVFPGGIHIVAAPWTSLLYQNLQSFREYARWMNKEFEAAILYSDTCNDKDLKASGIKRLSTPASIAGWIHERSQNPDKLSILLTTYASSDKIETGCEIYYNLFDKERKFKFSSLVCDESHRTVGDTGSLWTTLVISKIIKVKYKMFATATMREIGSINSDMRKKLRDAKVDAIGMDDLDIYGKIFYELSFKKAIEDRLICDFEIILVSDTPDSLRGEKKKILLNGEEIGSGNGLYQRQSLGIGTIKQLIESGKCKKILAFSNNNNNSWKSYEASKTILGSCMERENILFTSSDKSTHGSKTNTIAAFDEADISVLFNCQQIKEGIDIKTCDTIVFLDPRTSKIDIAQAIGRALRIDPKNPDKKAKIILPVECGFNEETGEVVFFDESYEAIKNFMVALHDMDESIRESFDMLIQNIKESGKKPRERGRISIINFEFFTVSELEKIRIRILRSTGDELFYPLEESQEIIEKDQEIWTQNGYNKKLAEGSLWRNDYFMFPPRADKYYIDFPGWPKYVGSDMILDFNKFLKDEAERITAKYTNMGFCYHEIREEFQYLYGDYFICDQKNPNSKEVKMISGNLFSIDSIFRWLSKNTKTKMPEYWSEERIREFFIENKINSRDQISRTSREGNLPKGIPTKDPSYIRLYEKKMCEFYEIQKEDKISKEDQIKMLPEIFIRYGLWRSDYIGSFLNILGERYHGNLENITGKKSSELLIEFSPKNMATIGQCSLLIKHRNIKNNEEWNNIIQEVNKGSLVYPRDLCDYYFSSRRTPDRDYPISQKLIILNISNKIEIHQKYCYGNFGDVKNWLSSNGIKDLGKSFKSSNKPFWVPINPQVHFGKKSSSFYN
jgi:superfamily II DNA or RNA helicase